jgi:hypothetical protein
MFLLRKRLKSLVGRLKHDPSTYVGAFVVDIDLTCSSCPR